MEDVRFQKNVKTFFHYLISWWSPDFVTNCLSSNREKVCIPAGLTLLAALLLLIACLLLICRRCKARGRNSGDAAACALYCFVGNLCSAVGAFLSDQLAFQVVMGAFMAALDVVNFISIIFPICLWLQSKSGKRLRMMKMRRRQNLLAVCLLFVVGGGVSLGASAHRCPAGRAPSRRTLLSVFLHDHTELLGYVLGLISVVINGTSRFPSLSRAYRGELRSAVHVSSGVLRALASGLYAAAMLLYDTHSEFVLKALPWILIATCCGALDLTTLAVSCVWARGREQWTKCPLDSDAEFLLGVRSAPSTPPQRGRGGQACRKQHHASDGASLQMIDMGHYMDVNIQPVRKVCLKEVRVSREGQSESQPARSTVKVVRVDETCSSDTSSLSSELEWDFDQANAQWSKVQNGQDAFPLQQWAGNPGSKPCIRPDLAEKMAAPGRLPDHDVTVSNSGK